LNVLAGTSSVEFAPGELFEGVLGNTKPFRHRWPAKAGNVYLLVWRNHWTAPAADHSGVVAMILRSALLQTLLGLAIGIPVAFYGVTLVKSQLYELTTVSSGALVVAVGMLLAAACVAGVIPARRAASVDPVRALRTE
jgi:hypothetical protein